MKRVLDSQKIFGLTKTATLAELKVIYRQLIKEWHPDKLQHDPELLAQAEVKSQEIIDAYHFLISISPETHQANIEEYTLTTSGLITDFEYKGITLKIIFQDGSAYEYLGVPKSVYIKMVNSSTIGRFARRHIFNSYKFRKSTKKQQE
jgi:molecular chaperone HscB